MTKIYVKPTSAVTQVPNPDDLFRPLPSEGAYVEDSRYWQRRIKDGDAVIAKPAKESAEPASESKAKAK